MALVVVSRADDQGFGPSEVKLIEPVQPALPALSRLRNTEMLAKTEGGDAVGPGEADDVGAQLAQRNPYLTRVVVETGKPRGL